MIPHAKWVNGHYYKVMAPNLTWPFNTIQQHYWISLVNLLFQGPQRPFQTFCTHPPSAEGSISYFIKAIDYVRRANPKSPKQAYKHSSTSIHPFFCSHCLREAAPPPVDVGSDPMLWISTPLSSSVSLGHQPSQFTQSCSSFTLRVLCARTPL